MKVVAVVPAYNEETTIADVLRKTRPFVDEILVIDDGSKDKTKQIALSEGAVVFCHVINRGLGASIGTGLKAAEQRGANVVITLDADGQHDPAEIPAFVEAIKAGAEVVIGSRLLHRIGMPGHRQLANWIGNFVTYILFGAWTTDSQSGFRAFSKTAVTKIEIKTNRMEVSSEIIGEVFRHKLKLKEIPIKAIYTEYSLSKGQSFLVGLKTLGKLILRRLIN